MSPGSRPARVGGAALLLVGGALTAVAAVALHSLWWGMALGVAATSVALLGLTAGWATRLPFGLGFAATVGWLTLSRPEGDYLVAGDAAGHTLLAFALAVVVAAVATLPRPGRDAGHGEAPT